MVYIGSHFLVPVLWTIREGIFRIDNDQRILAQPMGELDIVFW